MYRYVWATTTATKQWWGGRGPSTSHKIPRALFLHIYIFHTLPSVNQKKISHTHTHTTITLLTIMQLKIYVSAAHLTAYMNVNHSLHRHHHHLNTPLYTHMYTPPTTQSNQPTFEGNSSLPTQKRKITFGVMCIWCLEKPSPRCPRWVKLMFRLWDFFWVEKEDDIDDGCSFIITNLQ